MPHPPFLGLLNTSRNHESSCALSPPTNALNRSSTTERFSGGTGAVPLVCASSASLTMRRPSPSLRLVPVRTEPRTVEP